MVWGRLVRANGHAFGRASLGRRSRKDATATAEKEADFFVGERNVREHQSRIGYTRGEQHWPGGQHGENGARDEK